MSEQLNDYIFRNRTAVSKHRGVHVMHQKERERARTRGSQKAFDGDWPEILDTQTEGARDGREMTTMQVSVLREPKWKWDTGFIEPRDLEMGYVIKRSFFLLATSLNIVHAVQQKTPYVH